MEEKKPEIQEEFPNGNHGEVGDVSITEYRKNQMVRLAECFIVSPLCIYAGIRYRKELPKWLSTSLVVFGTATLAYNGSNFIINWNRDGKLIRQAVKQKKEEEKKIRERIVKGEQNVSGKPEEKPVVAEKPVAPVQKVEVKKPENVSKPVTPASKIEEKKRIVEVPKNGTNGAVKKIEEPVIEITEVAIVRPKYDNNIKQVVISEDTSEPKVTTVTISDDTKMKENIESDDDKKKEVNFVIVQDKPIASSGVEQKKSDDNNGSEPKTVG